MIIISLLCRKVYLPTIFKLYSSISHNISPVDDALTQDTLKKAIASIWSIIPYCSLLRDIGRRRCIIIVLIEIITSIYLHVIIKQHMYGDKIASNKKLSPNWKDNNQHLRFSWGSLLYNHVMKFQMLPIPFILVFFPVELSGAYNYKSYNVN